VIEMGQDGLGRWAWMIRDESGRVIASDDDYYDAAACLEEALYALKNPGGKDDRSGSAR